MILRAPIWSDRDSAIYGKVLWLHGHLMPAGATLGMACTAFVCTAFVACFSVFRHRRWGDWKHRRVAIYRVLIYVRPLAFDRSSDDFSTVLLP